MGNWWSRYHRYTEDRIPSARSTVSKREGIPFTTAVIDMDWHLVDDVDPKYGSGWTGYTWNKRAVSPIRSASSTGCTSTA
ncbi:MAG: hypothetical protein V9G11_02785 [Bifidobacterium adolescentis]